VLEGFGRVSERGDSCSIQREVPIGDLRGQKNVSRTFQSCQSIVRIDNVAYNAPSGP
jgi:hypothetical protein